MPPNLKTLLINLDRSPDRLRIMQDRLSQIGLDCQRVSAVEGRHLDLDRDPRVSIDGYRRLHGKVINPAEVGCYLSHLKACEVFLADERARFALILEDDVGFAPDFLQVLQDLTECASSWDMVKLSGFHSGTPVGGMPLSSGRHLCVMLSRHTGSAAYLVNRQAAQTYLAQLLPMLLPWDHAFDRAWALKLKVRLVHPMPTELDWAPTTMAGGKASPYVPFPWYRRLSVHRYRVANEWQRVCWGLRQWRLSR